MRLFDDVASRVDDPYLSRAFHLALRGSGATAPNPLVGCVIVRDGRVVGEGFHPAAGMPHAEIFALEDAGAAAVGSTAYVTLEPCSHHGKTPPCSTALINAGVSRVVIGMPDPNPAASGGALALREAGAVVDFAADPSPFEELNEGWLHRMRTGYPFVIVKVGWSLDARGSFAATKRASMTGGAGAQVTRALRRSSDAILVGAATVRCDDPSLTVRTAEGKPEDRQPLRVVLARTHLPQSDARVFTDGHAATLLLMDERNAESAMIPREVDVASYDSRAGVDSAVRILGDRGVNQLLVEPGPRLLTALWSERLIDLLVTVTAGGMAGPGAPTPYQGDSDEKDGALAHRMVPVEASIVGDVSVTAWRSSASLNGLDAIA